MSIVTLPKQRLNLSTNDLIKIAIERKEGVRSANGALVVTTGKRTGRSPGDKFIVKDSFTRDSVDWGKINRPIEPAAFLALWDKAENYLKNSESEHFASILRVGADVRLGLPVKAITETAWHQLFVRHMFIVPTDSDPKPDESKMWTLMSVPGLITDPKVDATNSDGVVMLNFSEKKVLICGMRYAGEMKKAMFSVLNFLLPAENVLPMHCAANVDANGENVALFFGLSGTGKTTLSADPDRYLIGDDEHGWSDTGVFNFEGGCYAKCINLSKEREPVIWDAIRDGAIMENVVLRQDNGLPDFEDTSLTKNTRAAYPLHHVDQRVPNSAGGHPRSVVFLCCDLYGVLPPVALLTKAQAAYYFLSGYTALVGSTEVGSTAEIQPTFSACFGAPFFPRAPREYGELLMKRIDETGAKVYLVNTGWSGGGYGQGGKRFSIATTRQIIQAIVSGGLEGVDTEKLAGLNIEIPTMIEGVDRHLLNPVKTWQDEAAYQENLKKLIQQFARNFGQFEVGKDIQAAGPEV